MIDVYVIVRVNINRARLNNGGLDSTRVPDAQMLPRLNSEDFTFTHNYTFISYSFTSLCYQKHQHSALM